MDSTVQADCLVWFRLRAERPHYLKSKVKMYDDARSGLQKILYCFHFEWNGKLSLGTWARGLMPAKTRKERFPHHSFLVKGPKAITLFSVFHPKVNTGNASWKLWASIPTYHVVLWERKEKRKREMEKEGGREAGREREDQYNKGRELRRDLPSLRSAIGSKAQALVPSSILTLPRFCREQTQKKKSS